MNGTDRFHQAIWSMLLVVVALCAPLAGCQAQTPPDTFDHAKAAALTPGQKARMDVAFFNDFVIYSSPGGLLASGGLHPRGDRIHALATEGFEVAWLAEKLFDFHRFGYKDTPYAGQYWNRIKELADGGDASAQCLITKGAWQLRQYGYFKPPQADVYKVNDYFEKSSAQGHPQCTGDWGSYQYKNDPEKRMELNLYGARKGCAECMARMSVFHRNGWGLPKDLAKAWCWALEANRHGDQYHYESDKQIVLSEIMDNQPNSSGHPENLTQYRPGTNCTEPIISATSIIESNKGE